MSANAALAYFVARFNVSLEVQLLKIGEEYGEVVNAHIGAEGLNPRKGTYATRDDLRKELLDVAMTALIALSQIGDETPLRSLRDHIIERRDRQETSDFGIADTGSEHA